MKSFLKIWLTILLSLIIVLILFQILTPKNDLLKASLNLNYFPFFPQSHLKMAQTLFKNNYEKEAKIELQTAKDLYLKVSWFDFTKKTKAEIEKTAILLNQSEKIRKEISNLEIILRTKPQYRDLNLKLSLLNFQLKNDTAALSWWEKAFYQDPNNKEVQTVGKIVKLKN
ncbi:hypothetical protein COT75_04290 [Candidatus Beckwithbacteria bacterium CG10_big_fil_rev_8_21_14_0_10_34_10]|uniref:Uncharacterized protein n=1 Tax=Candidatus Beckwithbacteria bacterium CG10_big_fil_rev_8_21_14_0_10_34_10 TaxID=1974495 RepID=A0A2H0W8B9_9BACT|nr:MAG: hypothetical protein COT75_04290 [Candidatus Beckwithbacteria bacterium CG10_big_fil_rev_8_21_14_0_10_34_10]